MIHAPRVDRVDLRLVVDNTRPDRLVRSAPSLIAAADTRPSGPELLLGPFGRVDRSVVFGALAVAVALLTLLLGVRLLQGSPSALTAEVNGSSVSGATAPAQDAVRPLAGPGERIVVVTAGDSLWSIAASIDPDSDPRPLVAALVERNGGDSLRIGQEIVIPRQLLD